MSLAAQRKPSTVAWAGDVHNALQIVQAFRECQNSLSTVQANLSALSNISQQKSVLEGAMRRRRHCFEGDGEAVCACRALHAAPGASSSSARAPTSRVAVAPLGVLVAFMPARTEALLSQHQDDQQRLLSALHQCEQKWSQRVHHAAEKLAALETRLVGAANSALQAESKEGTAKKMKVTDAAKRKAEAAAYMNSFYGTAQAVSAPVSSPLCSSASSSLPMNGRGSDDGSPAAETSLLSVASCQFYLEQTGLQTLAALFEGCRALVAALIRMRTALQELVLAVRNDLVLTLSGARAVATAISAWLQERLREVQPRIDRTELDASSRGLGIGAGAAEVRPNENSQSLKKLLTWEDAITETEQAVVESWQQWKDAYLTEESYILLTL